MARWFTAEATPAALAAWRRNPAEFSNTVKARTPAFGEIDLTEALQNGYVSFRHEDGRRTVWMFLRVGEDYDLLKLYHGARKLHTAVATAHGWFWGLPYENFDLAARFLKNFGPFGKLTLELNGAGQYSLLDLGDFWNKQRRFHAVTKLWINLEHVAALRESWIELHARLGQIDVADEFPVGSIPKRDESGHVELELTLFQELRTLPAERVRNWLDNQNPERLRLDAVELVTGELHGHLGDLARWRPRTGPVRPSFELILVPDNLWSALWYLFARDTQLGVGWRICPNHNKLFYPPRKDRFYCTANEQQRQSKQRWWDRNKEPELRKRREARRREGGAKK